MIKNLALALCVVAALVLAWWSGKTPAPLSAEAPLGQFSAGRAMVDDRVIARVPHPVGSAENAVVRDYLVHRLQAMGLETQVQKTVAFKRSPRSPDPFVMGATVENVIAVLPGRDRGAPALALMAHYDSVPASPGAADDAAGVSAALEVIRILKAQGTPARDVMLVITDGEEAGLLGAAGFFGEHPLARHVGFVVNMESRGGGGQAQMFQTGDRNGETIRLLARTAVHPAASSLAVYLYEHLPNDTDFTVSKGAGLAGLNYAFIGRQFDYHSPTSTSDNLDQGSLQHMGDQVLAQARALAFDPALPERSPNLVYSNTFGDHVLAYPTWGGWGVLILAATLLALGVWRAKRREAFVWGDVARGVGATAYLVLTAVVLFRLARHATGVGFGFLEQRQLLAQAGLWETALGLVALGAALYAAACAGRGNSRFQAALLTALAGAACSLFGLDLPALGLGLAGALVALGAFGKPSRVAGAWTGALATALVLGLAMQILAPATAFLVVWPLTVAALAGAASAMGAVRAGWMNFVIAVPAAIGLAWILGFAHVTFLGLDMAELMAVFVWLAALLIWPLAQVEIEPRGVRLAALSVVLLGFVIVAVVRLVPPWSLRHPQATVVTYVQDLDSGKASRVAFTPDRSAWTDLVLKGDGGAIGKAAIPALGARAIWSAPAKAISSPGPTVTFARQIDGSLLLMVVPPADARSLGLDIRAKGKVSNTTVNGRPTPLLDKPGQWSRLRFVAAPQGIAVGLRAGSPGEIEIRYQVQTPGWPAQAKPLPPRDDKTMAFDASDSTTVVGARRFTW